MWLSHEGVIVMVLIVEFSVALVSAEGAASWSQTNVKYDALESSGDPSKTPAGSSNSQSDSMTSQPESLKSPPPAVYLNLPERVESGCRACQEQSSAAGTSSDTLTCHIISGIFTKDRLSVGSHVVTTIPQHACSINVTATAIEHSHLVLTTSSGDHILTGRQQTIHKRSAGTDFLFYAGPPLPPNDANIDDDGKEEELLSSAQFIIADGPLDQSIILRVVKELEPGATEILYTYTIPKRNESTVNNHRTRHHRNPRSTLSVKRHNSDPILSSKNRNQDETSTSSKSVLREVSGTAELDKTSITSPVDEAQPQYDQPYLQTEPQELGHGRGLDYRKWLPNWNPYRAGRPELFPNGRFYQSAVQGSYDSLRKLPEAYGNPMAQPLYAPRYSVPLSHHQSPPMQSSFVQPDAIFSRQETPEAAFQKPEISLSQEDMGLDEPLKRLAQPETQFSQLELGSAQPEGSEEGPSDFDLQAKTGYQDSQPISAYQVGGVGDGHQSPALDPRIQQQLPAGYLQSQNPGYAFYPAGPRSDLLEIPIYQRRQSLDPGIVYHAEFYRNPFSPGVAGHALRVYGPQPNRPQDPQSPLKHPEELYPPRTSDGKAADESGYVYQPQPPPPPPVPAPARLVRADFLRSRRLDGANRFDDDDDDDDGGYGWKIAGFNNCSRTCGGGLQSTMVICVKMGVTPVRVTDENCGQTPRPTTTNVTCNNRPCQPSWEASDWSQCSTSCNLGRQVRQVECRQRISSATVVTVTSARCQHEARPEVERDCNADRPCYVWKIKEWSECSSACGKGRRTRDVACADSDGRPVDDDEKCAEGGLSNRPLNVEDCQMEACSKSWYHSRWPTQCSSDCGDGLHSRRVHCGADDKKCNEKTKPPTTKECRSEVPCGGTWFVSEWTPCSVSCGEGVRRRDVICVKKLDKLTVIVSDENCIESDRVSEEELCSEGSCPPTWFITDWSECSRTCNTGVQTREAKCLDDQERVSKSCDPLDKPELKQTCNTNTCVSKLNRNDAQPLVVSCRDQLKTCHIVVQARLCRYNFYKEACCFSCSSRGYSDDIVTPKTTIYL